MQGIRSWQNLCLRTSERRCVPELLCGQAEAHHLFIHAALGGNASCTQSTESEITVIIASDGKPMSREHIVLRIPTTAYTLFAGPEYANDHAYESDVKFFSKHRGRRLCIRRAISEYDEFDRSMDYKRLGMDLPSLWVLVRQESSGYHTIQTAWRGKAHWPIRNETIYQYDACSSDDVVLLLYRQFAQMGGMSTPCMENMSKQGEQWAAAQLAAQQASGPIH